MAFIQTSRIVKGLCHSKIEFTERYKKASWSQPFLLDFCIFSNKKS